MPTSDLSAELISIAADIREHVVFLHELGVENLQPLSTSVLRGNTVEGMETQPTPSPNTLGAQTSSTKSSVTSDRPNAAASRGLLDSLFGDLAPAAPKLTPSSETFEDIRVDIGDCTRCPLHQGRTNIVHTEGNRRARLMFVGEAPGADEDAQARPFVGRAGQLLTKIIEAIGFKREEVLIGNVNRCRPPGNRPPTTEEATMCKPFLLREIAVVQPEVIVVMGNTAMRNLLDTREGITRLRGEFQDYHGVKVMPTFHPAYLLRDPSKKKETWHDLKKVRDHLDATAKGNS